MAQSEVMTRSEAKTRSDMATLQAIPEIKRVVEVRKAPRGHWVGDGFPVRTIFAYDKAAETSPFLLMDYAGPYNFEPAYKRRGVGEHPHRGFETVTILYSGEVEHRDSAGGGGKIGPGDVQWMTAGSGVVHEEMHSESYTESGGAFEAIQLWVNLPARLKMTAPKYQTLLADSIPDVALAGGAGRVRVIAGQFEAAKGPAQTFTPMNLWDVRLKSGHGAAFIRPPGHTAAVFVLKGKVTVNGAAARESEFVLLDRKGEAMRIDAESDAVLLILSGEPIDEPVFGYGPFVMNNEAEIRRAMADYQSGQMGHLA
jgi:redox-sensitive bicupin YhaK (pirin superfamily)